MTKNYHIVMHTHWDREWYFTVDDSDVFLINHMIEVIEFLEKNKDITYMLDGQYILVEDFLNEALEYKDRLYKLIEDRQILIGPWYTQTDLILPNQESIVRNLYYGIKKSKKIANNPLMIAYCPDTFGHNIQMPQIYKMFGIDYTVFWRGVSKQLTNCGLFKWEGLDGSETKAVLLPAGYQGGKYLPKDLASLNKRLEDIENKYDNYKIEDYLIMNGHDQMPIQKDIKEVKKNIEKIRKNSKVNISNLEEYCKKLDFKKASLVKDDLNHCEFTRVHRTIDTTRPDIKSLVFEIERLIYNILEPLELIAYKNNLYYPSKFIENNLLKLFEAHSHDSMGSCNSDSTNKDIKDSLEKIQRRVLCQIELTKRLISKNDYDKLNLINTLAYKRKNEKVKAEILTQSPNFKLVDKEGKEYNYKINSQVLADMAKVNRQILAKRKKVFHYKTDIEFYLDEIDGLEIKSIDILEEKAEIKRVRNSELFDEVIDKIITKEFISFYSLGDDGDSYDSSPIKNDKLGKIYFKIDEKKVVDNKVILSYKANLPYNKSERENRKKSINQKIKVQIMDEGSFLDLNIDIENKAINHQVFINFKFNTIIKNVFCDTQFGFVKRENNYKLLDIWKEEGWVEKPVNAHKYQSFVNVNKRISIVNNSCKTFYYEKNHLSIPILRSYDFLGKSDLENRPGRASGMSVESPYGELIGKKLSHHFYIYKSDEKTNDSSKAKKILSPIQAYQAQKYNTFNLNQKSYPMDKSLNINLDERLTVSCTKLSEDKKYIFIRGFNSSEDKIEFYDKEGFYLSDVYENKNSELIYKLNIKQNEIINILKEII
ncbi:alpha-mannosidase MngB [Anaerococcus hydrogenalis DSM 7454]|uniref:Alpha-mannosidase MngB n=1 Tax=Anaerococcus hydrogenalis DSM 7454 TaxID=561177 RepID=B6WAA4_9FIRM|nr:glycoside hydrolase family 38 C-terminal domain-containing protein [Anaerococcus hydrogenalis]EEB35662.1 alpha-mannosidase MngB [Anaerococcus hydrogenalis DSM 7454]